MPNFSCHIPNHKSVFLQILHHSLVSRNITPLYLFSSSIIHFVQKESIKVQIFETFGCSRQNSSNFSCQFWNNKSIPLQFLHYSSLSWQITVNFEFMHFLFLMKGPHQSPNLGYFKCSVENLRYSLIIFFKAHLSFSSSFASLFSVMKKNSSVLF